MEITDFSNIEISKNSNVSFKQLFIDFNAGFVGGLLNVLCGHPLDTLKTRQQTRDIRLSVLIKETFTKEGIFGFYKGMSFPLYSVPIINSVVFGVNETTKTLLKLDENMSIKEGFISGAISGFAGCFIITPVELVKCRLQLQYDSKNAYYKNGFNCAYRVIKEEGFKGIYSGNLITILREVPGYSAQFAGYHFSKTMITKYQETDYNNLSLPGIMFSGAFAGYCCWQFSYPQDVIKTLIQSNREEKFKSMFKDGGIINCTKHIYKRQGIIGFWKGYGVCSIRAVYANSFLYYGFETSKIYFTDLLNDDI